MNREIKFRAWNGTEMSAPFDITSITKDDKYSGVVHEYRGMMDEGFFYLYECKIMQFTGLTDKNGKEIYEGDILRSDVYGNIEVWFEDGAYLFGIKGKSDSYLFQLISTTLDIIGNICENPELLSNG